MAAEQLKTLCSSRRAKLGVCTRKMNDLQEIMESGNVENVNTGLEKLHAALDEFERSHESVQELLAEEEKGTDDDWYKPKRHGFENFLKDVDVWKNTQGDPLPVITPMDSASNVASTKGHARSGSIVSRVSSISSARVKAEAEKAALEQKHTVLEKKHALLKQKMEIEKDIELTGVEAEIAGANAKIEVLQRAEAEHSAKLTSVELLDTPGDGMNDYLQGMYPDAKEDDQPELSPAVYAKISAVPKTPLQRVLVTDINQRRSARHATRTPQDTQVATGASHVPISSAPVNNNNTADIATLIVQQQKMTSLPTRDITVFDGEPLNYRPFMQAFEHRIEGNTTNSKDRLYYLEQFTSGQPQELVRSCLHMDPYSGYMEAKRLLKVHFGDEFKLTSAYIDKALNWMNIPADNGEALQKYALFLRSCFNLMHTLRYMDELNLPSNLRLLVAKVPYKLRERWRTHAFDINEKNVTKATFGDLVKFLERQAKILQDPVFGNLQAASVPRTSKTTSSSNRPISGTKVKSKGASFATTVAVVNSNNAGQSTAGNVLQRSSPVKTCAVCDGQHETAACPELEKRSHSAKVDLLKNKGICFGCLDKGHMSRTCTNRKTCSVCSKPHPTILHMPKADGKTVNSGLVSLKENASHASADDQCTLSIVPVQVKLKNSNLTVQTYAFLDPGSSATFCTEQLRQRLGAVGKTQQILLHTMGQKKTVNSLVVRGLEVAALDTKTFIDLPATYTQEEIPVTKEHIPKQEELGKWPYLHDVRIPKIDANIDLLIGINAPKLMEPWRIINSKDNGPFAMKTLLGWVVNGLHVENAYTDKRGQRHIHSHRISVETLGELLVQQYNHDFPEKNYDEKKQMSVEDCKFMQIMDSSAKVVDGHYELPLPFRKNNLTMPNNRHLAEQRMLSLKRKFQKSSDFHKEYKTFMETVLSSGHAELVPQNQLSKQDGKVWHIPHHAVFHPKKGNLRVVFDCSASYQGTSLNAELLQGPNLTNTLIGALTRFRLGQIALMADIEKMYYQVKVSPQHVDFLRFLWWPDGDITQPLKEHRMIVHLFGATSSASSASYALRKTAEDNKGFFSAEATKTVQNNFYVDDLLKAVDSEKHAIELYRELKSLCATGGFTLTKWICNSKAVLASIPEAERAKDVRNLDLDIEDLPIERALGVQWCVQQDTFTFHVSIKERPTSRRGILSMVCSIYDPLGFLAPITFPAKCILQELCKQNIGWDEELPEMHVRSWNQWWQDLPKVREFKVSRCFVPCDFGNIVTAQMHHFCDASDIGYGTVTYLRLTSSSNRVHVTFLMGKARVAPLKQMTTPRMELTAAVVAVRIDRMLSEEMHMKLERSLFWTDSMTVLRYIRNESKRFQTFVANRLNVIRSTSEVYQWRYIGTKLNPADCASRGMHIDAFLKTQSWIGGPEFLKKPPDCWPETPTELDLPTDDLELKRFVTVNVAVKDGCDATTYLMNYFSTWMKLKRAVAWFLRLKSILLQLAKKRQMAPNQSRHGMVTRQSKQQKSGPYVMTVNDMEDAEMAIVQYCQRQGFTHEVSNLQKGMPSVSRSSLIYRLDPFMDSGTLRVGGRLRKRAMPIEQKHPAILPKDHHVSKLIVHHVHEEVGHSGRNFTLSKLRQRYWIPCANALARKVINDCLTCRKAHSSTGQQKMADLPVDRLTSDLPPFTHVGVDYFGPLEIRRGRGIVKRYGVIFTCLTSRAIHLEVAQSLDTDSCIHAFRRFIARRGQVSELRSDNGTNLVAAEKELKEALKSWNLQQIQQSLLQKGVKWTFNPPHGVHHGGIWERLIRMVKRILQTVTGQQHLDDEGLQTVMCEIEAILNSRPLTTMSDDPNDLEPLTPNHLLNLKVQPVLPPGLFTKEDSYARRRWKQVQYIADLFWNRWTQEYLPLLQMRQKWTEVKRNFREGDIVLVADSTAPRGSWLLARVIKALPDSQGMVRSVRLQTKTSQLERPVSKICLLVEGQPT